MQPNSFDVLNEIDEYVEGMDRGCPEEPTNLQEEVTKGGVCLMFCMRGWIFTIFQSLDPIT